jgi:hypothetical protein
LITNKASGFLCWSNFTASTTPALEGFPLSRTYPYQLLQEGFAVHSQTFAAARITAASSGWRTSVWGFGDFDDVMAD